MGIASYQTVPSISKRWLVTGVGGFIGSNLLQYLLESGQQVVGIDDFSTGYHENLNAVEESVSKQAWRNFELIEGDIRDRDLCSKAAVGVNYILHQAALGSVPRSLENPVATHEVNVNGFLNMLVAARDANVDRFVYASSSSVYGDDMNLPKVEGVTGNVLSPYALTKLINEQYARIFAMSYGLSSIGLRYFNVFGRRQDPNGAYAAVIPRWISAMLRGEEVRINGDGLTSRDFCFIENVVQANMLAATAPTDLHCDVFNVAFGGQTSLLELHSILVNSLHRRGIPFSADKTFNDFRDGDIRHSNACLKKIQQALGYNPLYDIKTGLEEALDWYIQEFGDQ